MLTRQIATMLGAGVPLVQTIEMIGSGHNNGNMQKLLATIGNKLQSGIPLSECLREHPAYFDDLYCDLVNSGEQSGALETIYDRVATYKEKAEDPQSENKKSDDLSYFGISYRLCCYRRIVNIRRAGI